MPSSGELAIKMTKLLSPEIQDGPVTITNAFGILANPILCNTACYVLLLQDVYAGEFTTFVTMLINSARGALLDRKFFYAIVIRKRAKIIVCYFILMVMTYNILKSQ